jgi:exosome complex component RRP41
MAYTERFDKRTFDELRPIQAKAGVIKNAEGSAWFKIGKTEAYAAVYGPRDLYPRFLQNPSGGILRCNYNMMPFSGAGERVRPGQNRRAKEISMVTENALLPVLDLSEFPNAVVDVFIELPQTDAGSRCAGICAAAIALADAGIPMKDMVSAVAVGRIGDNVIADLSYEEEAYEEESVADIPVAVLNNSNQVSLLQMDGEIPKEMMVDAIKKAIEVSKKIHEVQVNALKERYSNVGGEDNE